MSKGDSTVNVFFALVKAWKKVFRRKSKTKSRNAKDSPKKAPAAASGRASSKPTAEATPKSSISSPIAIQTTNLDAYGGAAELEPMSPFKDPRPAPPIPDTGGLALNKEIIVEKADDSPMQDQSMPLVKREDRPGTPVESIASAATSTTTQVVPQTAVMAKRVAAPNLVLTAPTSVPANFASEPTTDDAGEPTRASHGTFYEAETPGISSADVSRYPIGSLPPPSPPLMSATSGPMGDMFPAGTPRSITPLSTISAR